jgi:hypothetical protein
MNFSYQGCHPPSQLAALAAHTYGTLEIEQPWYLNSGANHHVTSDLANLSGQQSYHKADSVTVGNRGGPQIANTGFSLISTSQNNFQLNNMLYYPNASSNLLSIQKF